MMRERRKTLRSYLDALRLARNALAHHKPLSTVQRLLVEHYAREIFAPVSQSWREGRTTVNPDTHLLASTDGLKDWLAVLSDDVREVQDELAALKEDVASTKPTRGRAEPHLQRREQWRSEWQLDEHPRGDHTGRHAPLRRGS